VSDAAENMMRCAGGSAEERTQQMHRIKEMKVGLTTTNFKLGDERPVYLSTNHESMALANRFHSNDRASTNTALKDAVKKSSIHFGNESVVYESASHDAMKYRGTENNFNKLKEEVQTMTATLRKHNFTFGDEKVHYETDYHRGYGNLPTEAYQASLMKKKEMKNVIEDSRACHFSLGIT
jgi:hypothetical protein